MFQPRWLDIAIFLSVPSVWRFTDLGGGVSFECVVLGDVGCRTHVINLEYALSMILDPRGFAHPRPNGLSQASLLSMHGNRNFCLIPPKINRSVLAHSHDSHGRDETAIRNLVSRKKEKEYFMISYIETD